MYWRGGSKTDHNKATKEQSDSSKYAELLVFGYACKLFRDDQRAIYHDQGKHLIPWMGEKNIMIDRYDGRGHLHDLSEYDAGSWNHDYQLSEEEARIEALCDEERYLAMHTDLLEEEARQEEEYKRLSEALADEGTYNAVAFRYSADYYDPSQPTEENEASKEADQEQQEEESEEPFVAPPGLLIPPDVELPATTKTHAIIERTANFVCKQGAQFEIVLKAKQAGNSQFDFLWFDHYLNPYYKHILRAMKEGRYTPASEGKQDQQQESKSDNSDNDDDDDDGDGSYLHPSLFASKKSSRLEEIMKPLQVIDPDHPLAALVRKARQENYGAAAMATKAEEEHQSSAVATQAEYTSDPNVAAMYYGYCMLPDGTYCLAPPPPGIDASPYYASLPTGMMPAPPASVPPPPPGTTPSLDPVAAIPSAPAAGSVTVSAPASAPLSLSAPAAPLTSSSRPPQTTVAPMVPAAAAPVAAIIPPPPDIQPVIDKLAEYVARNGVKFESSVRAKNDPRFDFLQSWHQYNSYYEFKKHYFMQKEVLSMQEGSLLYNSGGDSTANCSSDKQQNEGKLIKVSFAPICFAIKSKENDLLPLEKNRVRLDDDSDEDGMKGEVQEGVELAIGLVEAATREPPQPQLNEEKKPVLSLEELEAKQAKQKLEDRLAAAAREKLAQASKESKERQLQAERKRKAALFLQTLRGPEAEVKHTEETAAAPEVCCKRSFSSRKFAPWWPQRENEKGRSVREKDAIRKSVRESQSRSPSRRDRRARSSDRKRDEREKESYGPSTYRLGSNPALGRKRSRSSSPHEKKKKKGSKSSHQFKGSSCSPSASPDRGGAMARVSASPSPATSPASSLGRSRDGSQEKDKQVSSTIVSSVQSKITQRNIIK
ncbi:splicing factor, suppressor of white-apricot homolog [Sinocyclocheilus anshuiensis]|uniref:splicing factor, suppressor of white-apricot homolog n=1 Tax=Sinocyclocheilus anshuiensis TaxID=1608454 RepID=UPI0007B8C676|nr:PREDICTED: splicing factor, suppressor of white-apricot homolog [Sinocyclocheilus anshuiensis]